jgi:hypothetical protein
MPKKTARKNKSAFVRSFPTTMSATEVVAKGAEQKLAFTEQYVHQVRTRAKKTRGANKTGAANTAKTASRPAKKSVTTSGRRGKAPDKKKRVLELHAANPSWTGHQLAEAAGSSTTYVYRLLREPKKSTPPRTTASSKTRTAPLAKTTGVGANSALTDFFRAVKAIGGAVTAMELLRGIEAYERA